MNRTFERSYPWLVAALAATVAYCLGGVFDSARIGNQLSSTISISAILMGFLGTAKAMLLTLSSKRFAWVKSRERVWDGILSYFREALLANFALCIYSLILFSIDVSKIPALAQSLLMPSWAFLVALAVFSFYRVLKVIFALLKQDN